MFPSVYHFDCLPCILCKTQYEVESWERHRKSSEIAQTAQLFLKATEFNENKRFFFLSLNCPFCFCGILFFHEVQFWVQELMLSSGSVCGEQCDVASSHLERIVWKLQGDCWVSASQTALAMFGTHSLSCYPSMLLVYALDLVWLFFERNHL